MVLLVQEDGRAKEDPGHIEVMEHTPLERKAGRLSLRLRMSNASQIIQDFARRPSIRLARGASDPKPKLSFKNVLNGSIFRGKPGNEEEAMRTRKRGIFHKEKLPSGFVIPQIEITDVDTVESGILKFQRGSETPEVLEKIKSEHAQASHNVFPQSELPGITFNKESVFDKELILPTTENLSSHGSNRSSPDKEDSSEEIKLSSLNKMQNEVKPTKIVANELIKFKVSIVEVKSELPNGKRNTFPLLLNPESYEQTLKYKSMMTSQDDLPRKSSKVKFGKTLCEVCHKKCAGEVLRVQEKYFHISCFKCKVCGTSLAQGGFFSKDSDYYCTKDYQDKFGTRCAVCKEFVEGDVVTALGNTYHQKCFTCARCRQAFPTGERVTFTGKECLCQKCSLIPVVESRSPQKTSSPTHTAPLCAGCKDELKEGQALIALDKQWHIWCFKCNSCGALLHGEYMGKDGQPYCEKDYQLRFGVKCAYCDRFISGKVLQAGDNHHFHPTCARCSKCGDPFGDGEEMYLQGAAIWHPRCGPGPAEGGTVLNGGIANVSQISEVTSEGRESRISSSAASEIQYSGNRSYSPGLMLRDYNKMHPDDISRIYTYSYLTAEPTQGYMKRPIEPYDKPPKSPHFHRPISAGSKARSPSYPGYRTSKPAMKVLIDSLEKEHPRPKSPHMNNEEPIELSHFPAGHRPKPDEKAKIERDDFPAPPYPYTDPERRRRWSGSVKNMSVAGSDGEHDYEEEVDSDTLSSHTDDPKLKKEEEELSKIATGIGKVFLHQLKEREKIKAWKATHIDPRNASRAPSANHEVPLRLRYDSPINASPSRLLDRPRTFDDEGDSMASGGYRSSWGRSAGTLPSYNVVSALRSTPRPGYTLKASTLPASLRNGNVSSSLGDYSMNGMGDKTQSIEFSSNKSDISATTLSEADRRALGVEMRSSNTYSSGLTRRTITPGQFVPSHQHFKSGSNLRRSLPNMSHSAYLQHLAHMSNDPPKIYPVHLLFTTNYRLPVDVDRCHLERHLSDVDFEVIFQMSRGDFYRIPEWRRNELKKRVKLY
ncbi:actin-binding LIM protein 3-like isoform X3 [Artemia franciscana]|uniref:actin-binding LIM protein 3-like isoform X3 n=1 Tax=Artemia franciscana TaxID=6661 RepID=UPI0032DB0FC3